MKQDGFRSAVELDDYLNRLTDDERAALRPQMDVAFRDQVDAAAAEGIRLAEAELGHGAVWVPHGGIIDWVRLGMLDVVLKWFNNEALTCIHMPAPGRPEPVYAAAWKPGIVVCAQCIGLLSVSGVADTICDGCGHQCKGMPDDGITPFTTFIGTLGYQAGACDSCHTDVRRVEREAQD